MDDFNFERFAAEASDLFGLDENEAADLLDELEAQGYDAENDTLFDDRWGVDAADRLDDIMDDPWGDEIPVWEDDSSEEVEEPDYGPGDLGVEYDGPDDGPYDTDYELDPDWPDDEWLEAYEEYEVSTEYEEA